jgi:hypothetical protein
MGGHNTPWVDRPFPPYLADDSIDSYPNHSHTQSSLVRAAAASLRGERDGGQQQRRWGRLYFSTEPALQNAGACVSVCVEA